MVLRIASIGGGGGQSRYLKAMELVIAWITWVRLHDYIEVLSREISEAAIKALASLAELDVNIELTGITTVADSGGSTGELGIGYLGDVTKCIAAISQTDGLQDRLDRECSYGPVGVRGRSLRSIIHDALSHGFGATDADLYMNDLSRLVSPEGNSLEEVLNIRYPSKHSLKNLILYSLIERWESQELALQLFWDMAGISHRMIPVSFHKTNLEADLWDGEGSVVGEANIDTLPEHLEKIGEHFHPHRTKVVKTRLTQQIPAADLAIDALQSAHLIVYPPGDLWTSSIPALRIQNIKETIIEARANGHGALTVAIIPLMTKPWETHDFNVSDYVYQLQMASGTACDRIVYNTAPISPKDLARYHYECSKCGQTHEFKPVTMAGKRATTIGKDEAVPAQLATTVVEGGKHVIRHDIDKLAEALVPIVAWAARRVVHRERENTRLFVLA